MAIEDFSEAIRLKPELVRVYRLRRMAYQTTRQWAEADADFAKVNAILSGGAGTAELARRTHAGFHVPDPERIPSHLATNPGTPWGDYLGSEACRRCHETEYAKWRRSFHSRTLYDAAAPTVFGDFSGKTRFDDLRYPWFIVEPYTREDPETGRERYYMKIRHRTKAEGLSDRARSADTYGAGVPDLSHGDVEVIFAFGNRRHQPYVARWPDGKHWVLPILWNDVKRSWEYDGFRPYVESCATCHTTGIRTSGSAVK